MDFGGVIFGHRNFLQWICKNVKMKTSQIKDIDS